MLHTLKLLLPALIPSWRFFDIIAPSPRVQFTLLNTENEPATEWHEYRPRPEKLSFSRMLARMLWNPAWNELLFVFSCAERLLEHPTKHSENEILKRIIEDLKSSTSKSDATTATHLQFRLLLIQRKDSEIQEDIAYHSRIQPISLLDTE